jgi:hypothetical protein
MNKLLVLLLLYPILIIAQVGVNTTTPNAMLDVQSTNNGVLIPRVALTSITDAITVINPAGGALTTSTLVYNTATAGVSPNNVIPGFYYWNNTTSRWIAISGSIDWNLNGNTAITSPAVPVTYGTSTIGATENFIGTTDNNDVTIGTNSIERMRVKNTTGNVGIGTANPTEKLHVFDSSDSNKSSIFSEASQTSSGIDYQNIAIKGYGRATPSWGFANGVMGIGDTSNSYFATGVYAHLGSTAPLLPSTDQALFANGNNLGYAGIFMNGNVGIGTNNPSEQLHVFENADANKSVVLSEARQVNIGIDYQNIAVRGFGSGVTGWGYGAGVIGIGDPTNSYFATGVQAHLGATTPVIPATNQALYANGNGLGRSALFTGGNIVIQDGTQANGRVLTSDATGVATWQPPGINSVIGVLSVTGSTVAYNTAIYLQTGSYITLPPGRYVVNVSMLMARAVLTMSPNDSYFWVRSSFSDSAGVNPTPSPDIVGSNLISGNHGGTCLYTQLQGYVIINNTSGANKTYYYIAGNAFAVNTTQNITNFGSTYWAEDNIIAYRLN